MTIDWAAIVTAIAALAGVIVAFDARKTARQKLAEAGRVQAEAGHAAAESVEILLAPLNARITELSVALVAANETIAILKRDQADMLLRYTTEMVQRDQERGKLHAEIDEMRGGVMVLVAQLEQAGIKPRWKPKTGPLPDLS